jgi:hypothetical protein
MGKVAWKMAWQDSHPPAWDGNSMARQSSTLSEMGKWHRKNRMARQSSTCLEWEEHGKAVIQPVRDGEIAWQETKTVKKQIVLKDINHREQEENSIKELALQTA